MRKVWKIGSRWDDNGAPGTSILDTVFIPNRVVFATTTLCLEITNDADGIVFLLNAEQKEFMARKKTQIKPDENFWRIVGLPPAYAQGIGVMIRDFMSSVAKAAAEKGVSL